MKISDHLWSTAVEIYKQYQKQYNKKISRNKLANALNVSERTADSILFAIENLDTITRVTKLYNIEFETTELLLSDIHIPYHNKRAINTVFRFLREHEITPTHVVILGDLIDFYQISTFDTDPRRKAVIKEIDEAKDFLIELRQRFPNANIIMYKGNHCERFEKYIFRNAKEITDLIFDLLPTKLGLKELNIEYIERPFRIGKLYHLHGHERRGSYNVEHIINVMWKHVYDNFIIGHFHRTQQKIFKAISNKIYIGAAVGCLCQLDMEYAKLNNWNHGFAIIKYDKSGEFKIENKQIYEGKVF